MRKRQAPGLTRIEEKSRRRSVAMPLARQRLAGVGQVALAGGNGDAHGGGGLWQRQPGEIPQLDETGLLRLLDLELLQGLIEGDEVVRGRPLRHRERGAGVELKAPAVAAVL